MLMAAKTWDEIYGAGAAQSTPQSDTITPEELAELESMPKEALIGLIQRVSGAAGLLQAALMTEEQAYDAVCLKFLADGLSQKEIWKALPPLKEWADRRKGKPAQSIAMTVKQDPLASAKDEDIIRLLAMMKEPMIISPMPKRLDIE